MGLKCSVTLSLKNNVFWNLVFIKDLLELITINFLMLSADLYREILDDHLVYRRCKILRLQSAEI